MFARGNRSLRTRRGTLRSQPTEPSIEGKCTCPIGIECKHASQPVPRPDKDPASEF